MSASMDSGSVHSGSTESAWAMMRALAEMPLPSIERAPGLHRPILDTVRQEIVPRLVLSERAERRRRRPPVVDASQPTQAEVARLGQFALEQNLPAAVALAHALHARGATIETIYLDLLSPAARWMGDRWTDDTASFAAVSFGAVVLERVMRELAPDLAGELPASPVGRSVLLSPEPGDQHIFGIMMVGEFFRASGWDVVMPERADPAAIVRAVSREAFCVVVLSLACERRIEKLAALIGGIRRASRNQAIGVMVGGRAFNEHPDLVAAVGADATSADGRQAVRQAERLLALLPPRP